MTRLDEIKRSIQDLSLEERSDLASWLHNWTDDDWDRQMKRDAGAGRLDDLLTRVDRDIDAGRLRDMP